MNTPIKSARKKKWNSLLAALQREALFDVLARSAIAILKKRGQAIRLSAQSAFVAEYDYYGYLELVVSAPIQATL